MRILSNLSVSGLLGLNSVADANTDTDKFLVLDSSGIVRYRTGAEVFSDIGAGGAAAYTSVLQHTVKAGEALTKGQAVYVTGADGTNMIVGKASNATEATSSKTLGLIAQNLATNDQGFVVTEGLLAGIDTSTAQAGDPVWLGTNGNLIFGLANKPYAPTHMVFIGIVTRAQQNNGEIFVKVQNGFELQEIHNVQITSTPADNTVLAYETSTSLYKMKSIPTLLGYTPVTNARSITINGTTYDLSADRSWSVGTHTGNLTTGYVPKATGATTLTDSLIYDNGSGIGINTSSPYESSAFKLDVNGGLLIKNTSGTTAQLVLINSNPATGGNNGFVQLSAGGNTETAFGQWQTYYGMSVASGALRLQPAGGQVLIGTTTTSAFLTDINGTLRVSGQLTLGSTISNNTYVYTMPGASGTLALVSQIPSLSGYLTIASADATYLTQSSAASIYLSQTSASNTYLTISGASSTYLSQANASNTYLTISGASSIYLSQTSASNTYLSINSASSIYLSQTSASNTYLTINNAASTYVSLTGSYANPSWITSLAWSKITGAPAFLTSYTETDTLASVTARGATTSTATVFNGGLFARRSQTAGNYTTAALWTESYDNTTTGIAFHISGNQGKFLEMRTNGILYWHGDTVWHSGNLTNLNQLTNGPGYITGYTETDTLASVTGRGATTSSPLYFSGGSSTTPALHIRSGGSNWSEGLAIHPLTDNTYALAFFRTKSSYTDNTDTWALGNMGETGIINHFALLRRGLTGSSVNGSGNAVFSVNPNGTFSFGFNPLVGSNTILHAGNYNSYSPTLTGGGASGTWGINISGTAAVASIATDLNAADGTQINFNNVTNTDYSTMTFFSRAWADVQGANGLAYNFTTHTNSGNGGYGALQIYYGESGYVFAPTSFRAPIFYDSQNTNYYVDPNGTSRLESVWARGASIYDGRIYVGGSSAGSALTINFDQIWTGSGNLHLQYSSSGNIDMNYGGGYTFSRTSLRAPIFYDYNNTGYYGDFDSTSNMYRIQLGGGAGGTYAGLTVQAVTGNTGPIVAKSLSYPTVWSILPWSDGDTYISTGIYYDNGTWVHASSNSNNALFRFNPSGPRWYSSNNSSGSWNVASDVPLWNSVARWVNNVTAPDDVRAPIFYDSANTGYYADFNNSGTSISINGGITTTAPGGSVLLKHAVSESDAWIFQENAANWGIYWKNAPSGHHTFGGYTTVGAETFGMSAANVSGNGVLTSNFVGATSAYAQWMLSNYTGYIWSASTIFAAGDMRAPRFYSSLSSGTMFSHGAMTDAIGYNPSYGTYIGSVVGGTYYLYANGTFFDAGTIRTLIHSGNFSSYALPLSGGTMSGAITTGTGTVMYIGNQNVSTSSRLIINWHTDSDYNYLIGKRAGGWTQPMDISFYTGIRYHAHQAYGGHKFYVTGFDGTEAMSIGNGDNHVRVNNSLFIGSRTYLHQSGAGGGQNLFTGVDAPTTANGRAQFIMASAYSDLVIASSQSNGSHGSTLSFTTYNPSNSNDYRKFVINQGNWGGRAGFLDFGFADAARTNPHDYINATDDVMSLDGYSKRVGINQMNPGYNLDVSGNMRTTGRYYSNEWIEMNNYSGLYSPLNGAHFYPNNGTYGSWRSAGNRNGWNGIEFDGSNGNVVLMINPSSNTTGFHNNSYGWQFYWEGGSMYVGKNSYGANMATVLDSSNYSNWAQPASSAINTSNIGSQSVNYASSSGTTGTVIGRSRGSFTVGGSTSTFYPVAFQIGSGATDYQGISVLQIERGGYDEPGYSSTGFGTFHCRIRAKADGWGYGASYVQVEANAYTIPMLADVSQQTQTSQLIVWLRGGQSYRWYDVEGGWSLNFSNPSGGNYVTHSGNVTYTPTSTNTIGGNFKYQQGWGNNYISGTFTAGGDVVAFSDARVKDNLRPIENVLDRICKSRGVMYDRTDVDSKNNIGFIAQELEDTFPELVTTDGDRKSVKYQNATAVLFEAIKEQQKLIEDLKSKLDAVTK